MDIQKKINERYITRQKDNYVKILNKTQEIEDEQQRIEEERKAFKKIYEKANKRKKKGDLNILQEFLKETETGDKFVNAVFYDLFGTGPEDLSIFATNVGINELTNRYGENFGNKLKQLFLANKIKYIDIQQLLQVPQEALIARQNNPGISDDVIHVVQQYQSEKLSKLLDLFTDDKIRVGIHRTGGNVSGKKIESEGLILSEHLSSGIFDYSRDDNIESTLSKNVSFYNDPGMAILQTCVGGKYKNYCGNKSVDIALIGIPKEKLMNNEEGIILYDYPQKVLNPKYVIGRVVVDPITDTIMMVEDNNEKSFYSEEDIEKLSKFPEHVKDKESDVHERITEMLKEAHDRSVKPEYQETKKSFMSFVKSLLHKKNRETQKEIGQKQITNKHDEREK